MLGTSVGRVFFVFVSVGNFGIMLRFRVGFSLASLFIPPAFVMADCDDNATDMSTFAACMTDSSRYIASIPPFPHPRLLIGSFHVDSVNEREQIISAPLALMVCFEDRR